MKTDNKILLNKLEDCKPNSNIVTHPIVVNENYHKNKMIAINAILMMWAGIALIIASFVAYVCKLTDTLIAGTICGCFIYLFSAIILYIFNKP